MSARVESSLIFISIPSNYVVTFYWVNGILIWGIKLAINHSQCCTSGNWNIILSSTILNLWSYSHIDSIDCYLISLNLDIHCDSDWGFWNSFSSACLISTGDLAYLISIVALNFMYHIRSLCLKVVSNLFIIEFSSTFYWNSHITSHVNQCCSTSSFPVPWNTGSFKVESSHSWVTILYTFTTCNILSLISSSLVLQSLYPAMAKFSSSLVKKVINSSCSSTVDPSMFLKNAIKLWTDGFRMCKGLVSKRGLIHAWTMGPNGSVTLHWFASSFSSSSSSIFSSYSSSICPQVSYPCVYVPRGGY